jgi:secondary thiamine-phosphate synthase enzyme
VSFSDWQSRNSVNAAKQFYRQDERKRVFLMGQFQVRTSVGCQMIDITGEVRKQLKEMKAVDGFCCVYVSHTTAGVTINENADPDVTRDILAGLEKIAPDRGDYRHAEGNSPAHIKSSLVGASANVIVAGGGLVLGTWQSIFFCEFDGPRARDVYVKFIAG